MTIYLKKFGSTLNSRQFGREALAAFKPSLKEIKKTEKIIVDFEGVITFTPSWGDEFLGFLLDKFGKRLELKNTGNLSVQASIKTLEEVYGDRFVIKHEINYNKSTNKDTDSTELKCIIDKNKETIFEFTYELLTQENFQNLREKSSADDFYKAIEKFLIRELDNNTLKDVYQIKTNNFWQYK